MSKKLKSNYIKYIVFNILFKIGVLFCIGAIIQSFMIHIGVSEKQVYLYNTLMQGIQVAVMFVMTFVSDRIGNVKAVMAVMTLSFVLLLGVLVVGAVLPEVTDAYVVLLFIASGISYVGYGVHSILSYVFPYSVLDMADYGQIIGISGGIGGVFTFLTSILHSAVISRLDYDASMIVFFAFAAGCLILSSLFCRSMERKTDAPGETSKKDFAKVLKDKSTYILLIPNFIRGISTGIVGVITVIAISAGIVDTKSSSYVNIVMQFAILAGSLLFAATCKKLSTKILILIGSAVFGVSLPLTVAGGELTSFLIFFGVMYAFMIVVDSGIPVLITEIIPQDEIGGYTSIRMMVFTAGTSVATLLIPPIEERIGYAGLLTFASVCLFTCCLTYFILALVYSKRQRRASGI